MSDQYTKSGLASAWESGYWHGTSHTGPLNDAAVRDQNPYQTEGSRDALAKEHVTARITASPEKETIMNNDTLHEDASAATPQPPAGFKANYFTNEFSAKPKPELIDYSAPAIERPGYKVLTSWTPEGGLRLFIDHEDNEAFTVAETCDLIATLAGTLQNMASEETPAPTPPAGYTLAEGCADLWIGEDLVSRQHMITPTWNAATNRRTLELWTAKGQEDESYTHLTPLEAIKLASDLITMAKDLMEGK